MIRYLRCVISASADLSEDFDVAQDMSPNGDCILKFKNMKLEVIALVDQR